MKSLGKEPRKKRAERRIINRLEQMERKIGVPVTVIRDFDQLPHRYQQGLVSSWARVRGFYDEATHQVFIVTTNIKTPREASSVYLHEVLTHLGLREAFGESLGPILLQIYRGIPIVARRLLEQSYSDRICGLSGKERRRLIAEEYLAQLSELEPKDCTYRRIACSCMMVIRWFIPGLPWTGAEMVQLLVSAKRQIKEQGGPRYTNPHMARRLLDMLEMASARQTQCDS